MYKYLLLITFVSTNVLCDPEYIDHSKLTEEELAILNGDIPYADFTDTTVTVDWSMDTNGTYVYNYSVNSNASNQGEILHFTIDISCKYLAKERYGYRPAINYIIDNKKYFQYGTDDPKYYDTNGASYNYHVSWWPYLKPGETKGEFQIFSRESPIYRKYELGPSWDDGDLMPSGAQYEDYTVNGKVLAPGCDHENLLNDPNTPENIEKRRVQSLIEQKQSEEKRKKTIEKWRKGNKPIMCVGAECF